jgi:hypothetical protein
MQRHATWLAFMTVVAAVTCARATAHADGLHPPLPNAGPPLILRLDGVLRPTAEAAKSPGFSVVSFAFLGDASTRERYLSVTDARTVGGDHPLLGKDVLNMVAPFKPSFLITGAPPLLDRLRGAADGTAVRIEGLVSGAGRTYYLRDVRTDDDARTP